MPSISAAAILWAVLLTFWAYVLARVVARAVIRSIKEKEKEKE